MPKQRKRGKVLRAGAKLLGCLCLVAVTYMSCAYVLAASSHKPGGAPYHSMREVLSSWWVWVVSLFPLALASGMQLLAGIVITATWKKEGLRPAQRCFELMFLTIHELCLTIWFFSLIRPVLLRYTLPATLMTTVPGLAALTVVTLTVASFVTLLIGCNVLDAMWAFYDVLPLPEMEEWEPQSRLRSVAVLFVTAQVMLVRFMPRHDLASYLPLQIFISVDAFALVLPVLVSKRTQLQPA